MWYIQTTEHYSALKKKEILIHSTTGMRLEDIFPSEISQLQNCKDSSISMRYLEYSWTN